MWGKREVRRERERERHFLKLREERILWGGGKKNRSKGFQAGFELKI